MAEALSQFGNQTFELSGQFVLTVIFLVMVYLFRRTYNNGKKDCEKMFVAKDGASPFDIVITETIGCLRIIIFIILMVFFFIFSN